MAQSPEQIEEALARAGQRLGAALDRIAAAADRRADAVDRGDGNGAEIEALEARVGELQTENAALREAGKAVADGIDQTIETLRKARA